MKKNPALFCFRNKNSIVHKIPCGIKLFLLLFITIRTFSNSVFIKNDFFTDFPLAFLFLRTLFYFCITLIFFFLAKTPLQGLLRLKFIFWIFVLVISLSVFSKNYEVIYSDLLYIFRFLVTTLFSLIVFETTSRLQILDTLCFLEEKICKIIPPLKKLHFAVIFSITITFIPAIFSEWNKITCAAASRSSFTKKRKIRFSLRSIYFQLNALFFNMLDYAEKIRKSVNNRFGY